jgi:hypothetical protein
MARSVGTATTVLETRHASATAIGPTPRSGLSHSLGNGTACGAVYSQASAGGASLSICASIGHRAALDAADGSAEGSRPNSGCAVADESLAPPRAGGADPRAYGRIALRCLPLVFIRASELRCADWVEFELKNALWRIPGLRMKMRDPHIVPLSRAAYNRAERIAESKQNDAELGGLSGFAASG